MGLVMALPNTFLNKHISKFCRICGTNIVKSVGHFGNLLAANSSPFKFWIFTIGCLLRITTLFKSRKTRPRQIAGTFPTNLLKYRRDQHKLEMYWVSLFPTNSQIIAAKLAIRTIELQKMRTIGFTKNKFRISMGVSYERMYVFKQIPKNKICKMATLARRQIRAIGLANDCQSQFHKLFRTTKWGYLLKFNYSYLGWIVST